MSAPLLFPTLFHSPIIYSDTPALKIAVRSHFRRAETSTEATNTTVQAPKSGEKSLKIFVAFSCYRRKTGGSPRHPKIKIAIKRHADYSKISGKSCKYPTVIPTKAPLRSQYSLPSDPKFTEKTMRQHLKSPLRAVRWMTASGREYGNPPRNRPAKQRHTLPSSSISAPPIGKRSPWNLPMKPTMLIRLRAMASYRTILPGLRDR